MTTIAEYLTKAAAWLENWAPYGHAFLEPHWIDTLEDAAKLQGKGAHESLHGR